MRWIKELETSKKAAKAAGAAILEIYEDPARWETTYKEEKMPLTAADLAANQIITDILRREFPDYAILSEEEQDNRERLKNPLCFIVDPLDGTKEFLKRNGQFTVNIALACRQKSVMGVIYVPASGELYYASQEGGAYLEDPSGAVKKLEVSKTLYDQEKREGALFRAVTSLSHQSGQMEELIERYHITDCVRIGSSLKGCLVAAGQAEIYYRFNPTMEWDTAAMQCIVEEAGGIFCQMDDSPMVYNREDTVNKKGFYAINRRENRLV